jgi:hypothetical protein
MSATQGRLDTIRQGPDQLPLLARGAHRSPQQGACLMEYVSVLAGERFSDRPRCTHPALALLARMVNDEILDPAARSKLALLAPELIGTRSTDPRIARTVAACCLRASVALRPHDRDLTQALRRVEAQLTRWENPRARRWAHCWSLLWEPQASSSVIATVRSVMKFTRADRSHHDERLRTLLEHAITDCCRLLTPHRHPTRRPPVPAATSNQGMAAALPASRSLRLEGSGRDRAGSPPPR